MSILLALPADGQLEAGSAPNALAQLASGYQTQLAIAESACSRVFASSLNATACTALLNCQADLALQAIAGLFEPPPPSTTTLGYLLSAPQPQTTLHGTPPPLSWIPQLPAQPQCPDIVIVPALQNFKMPLVDSQCPPPSELTADDCAKTIAFARSDVLNQYQMVIHSTAGFVLQLSGLRIWYLSRSCWSPLPVVSAGVQSTQLDSVRAGWCELCNLSSLRRVDGSGCSTR